MRSDDTPPSGNNKHKRNVLDFLSTAETRWRMVKLNALITPATPRILDPIDSGDGDNDCVPDSKPTALSPEPVPATTATADATDATTATTHTDTSLASTAATLACISTFAEQVRKSREAEHDQQAATTLEWKVEQAMLRAMCVLGSVVEETMRRG